jgi:hypothetical protein
VRTCRTSRPTRSPFVPPANRHEHIPWVSRQARTLPGSWLTLDPRAVGRILIGTAKQTPCPSPPNFAYPDDRDPSFDGVCEGMLARNGIYGRGIVNALTAVLH